MKYPYIGNFTTTNTETTVLFTGNGFGINFDDKELKLTDLYREENFTNITAEYLANTYGEVKSKEHAEFIKLLADVNQFRLNGSAFDFEVFDGVWFCFDEDELYFYDNSEDASDMDEKQITIPLPPECESVDEWPKVGSIVEWGHTGKGEVKSLSDGFAWIKLDNKDYTTVYVSSLRKPKTPEQELAEKLIEKYKHLGKKEQAFAIAKDIIQNAIDKYNITKKPQ